MSTLIYILLIHNVLGCTQGVLKAYSLIYLSTGAYSNKYREGHILSTPLNTPLSMANYFKMSII